MIGNNIGILNQRQFPISGCLSYWRFDELDGTNVNAWDYVGSITGILSNYLGFNASGKNRSCIIPNNYYVNYGANYKWNSSQAYSVSVWTKRNNTSTAVGVILSNMDASSNMGIDIYVNGSTFYFALQKGSSSQRCMITKDTYPTSEQNWTHWVFTYNGDRNANNMKMYKNSTLLTSYNVTNTLTDSTTVLGNVLNTGRRYTTAYACTMSIDELGIWNRVLTQAEVNNIYNLGTGTFY